MRYSIRTDTRKKGGERTLKSATSKVKNRGERENRKGKKSLPREFTDSVRNIKCMP